MSMLYLDNSDLSHGGFSFTCVFHMIQYPLDPRYCSLPKTSEWGAHSGLLNGKSSTCLPVLGSLASRVDGEVWVAHVDCTAPQLCCHTCLALCPSFHHHPHWDHFHVNLIHTGSVLRRTAVLTLSPQRTCLPFPQPPECVSINEGELSLSLLQLESCFQESK